MDDGICGADILNILSIELERNIDGALFSAEYTPDFFEISYMLYRRQAQTGYVWAH
jgi:hypothetical protein